jgi:hypothetical protein
MYVPTKYQMHNADEVATFIKRFEKVAPVWSDLLTIDYFYNHHSADYDGGLSFIDRLNKKIGHLHPNWDITGLKRIIRRSDSPQCIYVDIIKYLLDDRQDVFYYGI